MVIEVTTHHPSEPLSLGPDGLMTSTLQLIPNSQQRRMHSLLDRQSQYLKPTASVGTTTVCVKPRKSNVSGLPKPRFLRFLAAKRPNSISRVEQMAIDSLAVFSKANACGAWESY